MGSQTVKQNTKNQQVQKGLSGGAATKRKKETFQVEVDEEEDEALDFAVKGTDYQVVKKVLELKSFNYSKNLRDMSYERFVKVHEKFKQEKNGNRIVEALCKLIPEVIKMEDL